MFIENTSEVLNTLLQTSFATDFFNETLVDIHDGDAVLGVLGLLTLQFVVECVDRFLQELHLDLVLLLDVIVFNHDLLIVVFDVSFQLLEHAHL